MAKFQPLLIALLLKAKDAGAVSQDATSPVRKRAFSGKPAPSDLVKNPPNLFDLVPKRLVREANNSVQVAADGSIQMSYEHIDSKTELAPRVVHEAKKAGKVLTPDAGSETVLSYEHIASTLGLAPSVVREVEKLGKVLAADGSIETVKPASNIVREARNSGQVAAPTMRATHKGHNEISASIMAASGLQLVKQTPTTGAPVGSSTPAATGVTTTAALVDASAPAEEKKSSVFWVIFLLLLGLTAGGVYFFRKQQQANAMKNLPARLGNVKVGGDGVDQEEISKKTATSKAFSKLALSNDQSDSDSDDDLENKNQKASTGDAPSSPYTRSRSRYGKTDR